MAFKSVRLLAQAIHNEMESLRKNLMVSPDRDTLGDVSLANGAAQSTLNYLRPLIDELVTMADRPAVDDVLKLAPADYVATMKPLVRIYHQQLLATDNLVPCLCEDLQAIGTVLILMGDAKTIVRTAHHPDRPEAALAIEALIASMEGGTKQVVTGGVAAAEQQLGIGADTPLDEVPENSDLRVKYHDAIRQEDLERNQKAAFVVDMNDVVVKDRYGEAGRKATQEEIDGCIVVKDPGTDDV